MFLRGPAPLLLLCLYPLQAMAVDLAAGVPGFGGLGADLHMARDEIELTNSAAEPDTTLLRTGVTLTESAGNRLSMGLMLGYASASQTDQPLTAGMRLTGYYLGVNIHGAIPLGERLRIGLMGQFLYQWMSDNIEDQRVEMEWSQVDTALTLQAGLTKILTVYAGPLWSTIEVDQQSRGDINDTTSFENRHTTGGVYGAQLEVESQGWIAFEVRHGPLDGVVLSFQRRF